MNKTQQVQLHQIRSGTPLWKIKTSKLATGHTVIDNVERIVVSLQPFHIVTDVAQQIRMWFFHSEQGVETYPFLSVGNKMDEEPSSGTAYFTTGEAACQFMNAVLGNKADRFASPAAPEFVDTHQAERHDIPNQYFQEK